MCRPSSQFYYGGDTGIIPWYQVPFFLLGVFYALFRLRSVGLLLIFWLIFGIIGISFLVTPDWTVRWSPVFPALPVFIAIGLRSPLEIFSPLHIDSRLSSRFFPPLI